MANIIISSGDQLIVSSGENVSYASITSGGQLTVSSGGSASYASITSGGQLIVSSGGSASYASITSGGQLTVSSGGSASYASITSGGQLIVSSGGSASYASITSGGQLTVSSGINISGAIISSGGELLILSGGNVDYIPIYSGGKLSIFSGGSASFINIYSGGKYTVSSGINTPNIFVRSGGQLTVTSGAIVSNVTFDTDGELIAPLGASFYNTSITRSFTIFSGVNFVNTSVYSDAVLTVSSGAIISDTQVFANGTIIVTSGAIVSNTSVGSLIVSSGGNAIDTYVYANGDVTVLSGGSVSNTNLGGKLTVFSGGSVADTSVHLRANIVVLSGGKLNGEIILNGGNATIYPDAGGIINLPGNNNNGLTILGLENGGVVTTVIKEFDGASKGWSDQIKLAGVKTSNVTNVAYEDASGNANGDFVSLSLKNGNKVTLNIPGAQKEGYTFASDADGNLIYEVCFLAGTMIKTPEGEVAVEDIRIGDKVLTFKWQDNKEETQSVRWIGNKTVKANPDLHDDEAGYPVRILKDAIADGIPFKDLLITPEHCLFFDGKFTPARMFVNGYSVYYDYSITNYTYYHIETESHSVIWANEILTESYLDTGNQAQFKQHGDFALLIRPKKAKTWEKDSAAPLGVDRSYVEPLYHTLLQRAIKMDLPTMQNKKQLTRDPDFHLLTQDGLAIEPISNFQGRYIFDLPDEQIESIYLVSRTSRQNDIDGSFENNRHELGILVGNIQIIDTTQNIQATYITDHLTQHDLLGWHALEQQPCRWTKGKALLNIPDDNHKERKLIIQVCSDRLYVLKQKQLKSIAV